MSDDNVHLFPTHPMMMTVFNPVTGKHMEFRDVKWEDLQAIVDHAQASTNAAADEAATSLASSVLVHAAESGPLAPRILRRVASILTEHAVAAEEKMRGSVFDMFIDQPKPTA